MVAVLFLIGVSFYSIPFDWFVLDQFQSLIQMANVEAAENAKQVSTGDGEHTFIMLIYRF